MPAEPITPAATRIQRPQTFPNRLSASHAAASNTEDALAIPDIPEENEIELLEYEWPDLPPLPTIKDAITRNRISRGISYLLPVDKGYNSVNNTFRTDLRAMFQEPYASDDLQYDDNRVTLSSKVHFLSNSGTTKWTQQHLDSIPVNINAESEQTRRLYSYSAPGGSSGRVLLDPDKMRARSSLYLPLKASVPPELIKLRKEVEQIIQSVQEDEEEFARDLLEENAMLNARDRKNTAETVQDTRSAPNGYSHDPQRHRSSSVFQGLQHPPNRFPQPPNPSQCKSAQPSHQPHPPSTLEPGTATGEKGWVGTRASRAGSLLFSTLGGSAVTSLGSQTLAARLHNFQPCPTRYSSYEVLRETKPPKPQIPASLKSEFLDDEQNQIIWEWLHHGETMSDFDFFLSVCG